MNQQNIIGIINLSIPVILFFYMAPALLHEAYALIAVSLVIGVYVWYLNWRQHTTVISSLKYEPTGEHKEIFDQMITQCGLASKKITVKYAYTAEQIGLTMSNMVIVDPTLCSIADHDVSAEPVRVVYQQLFLPKFDVQQIKRVEAIKNILSDNVQRFIFKHELGHVVDNYSYKKLWLIFGSGFCMTYAAVLSARYVSAYTIYGAIGIGMWVALLCDIGLLWLSNSTFKLYEEKKADRFAVQHCTAQEVHDAAIFFKQLQEIYEQYPIQSWLKLPSQVLSGHLPGDQRASYIIGLISKK